MKTIIVTLGLLMSVNVHATIFMDCTEDADPAWIDLSVTNWRSGVVQSGIVMKSVKDARALIAQAFDKGIAILNSDALVTDVVTNPDVVAIIRAKAPHTPAACAIWSGEPLQQM